MENKQAICDALLPVLKMTEGLQDLESMEYRHDNPISGIEVVICTFRDPYGLSFHREIVDVTDAEGSELIKNIINRIA